MHLYIFQRMCKSNEFTSSKTKNHKKTWQLDQINIENGNLHAIYYFPIFIVISNKNHAFFSIVFHRHLHIKENIFLETWKQNVFKHYIKC